MCILVVVCVGSVGAWGEDGIEIKVYEFNFHQL